jgi:hypothetical protein
MIKEYKFQYDENGQPCAVTIVGENISIPLDPANSDYQRYLRWLENPEAEQSTLGHNNV